MACACASCPGAGCKCATATGSKYVARLLSFYVMLISSFVSCACKPNECKC